MVIEQAVEQQERRKAVREAQRHDRGPVAPGRRSAAAEAALAAIRARTPGHLRRADRAALLDAAPLADCDWPAVAQPGAGLPHGLDKS